MRNFMKDTVNSNPFNTVKTTVYIDIIHFVVKIIANRNNIHNTVYHGTHIFLITTISHHFVIQHVSLPRMINHNTNKYSNYVVMSYFNIYINYFKSPLITLLT